MDEQETEGRCPSKNPRSHAQLLDLTEFRLGAQWRKERLGSQKEELSEENLQMLNYSWKAADFQLPLEKTQIKTTMRHHFIPAKMAIIKKTNSTKY